MTNKEAIEVLKTYDMSEDNDDKEFIEAIKMAIKALEIFEQAKEAGFHGKEVEFYIGGRKFAIRELAQ